MTQVATSKDQQLSEAARIGAQQGEVQASPADVEAFLQHYFRHVDAEDVTSRSPEDIAALVRGHVALAAVRRKGEEKVRVLQPSKETDGYDVGAGVIVDVVADDRRYIIDSLTMEATRQGWNILEVFHPQNQVIRDGEGRLQTIVSRSDERAATAMPESWVHMELAAPLGKSPADLMPALEDGIRRVLDAVEGIDADAEAMEAKVAETIAALEGPACHAPEEERAEAVELLRWLADDHFAFIGYREYDVDGKEYTPVKGTGLGVLRGEEPRIFDAYPVEDPARLLVVIKDSEKAPVHRNSYLDYVGIRVTDEAGKVVGERRFLGLLDPSAYTESVFSIPSLRRKAEAVVARSGYDPDSHGAHALRQALDTYPRDELFQVQADELAPMLESVSRLKERRQVRLFVRRHPYGRFLTCQVYLPRDRYTTAVRRRIEQTLLKELGAESLDFQVKVSESVLARLTFVVKMPAGAELKELDVAVLERKLSAAVRAWDDEFMDEAEPIDTGLRGIEFPDGYKEDFSAHQGVQDLQALNDAAAKGQHGFAVYAPDGEDDADLRLKVFSTDRDLTLSRVMPHLTLLGVTVLDERPYAVELRGKDAMIYDFGLKVPGGREALLTNWTEADRGRFTEAFESSYSGVVEADALNQLVGTAKLTAEEVSWLRAYSRYLQQAGVSYSQAYIAEALTANPALAAGLVKIFRTKFDPRTEFATMDARAAAVTEAEAEVLSGLEQVASLDHDRIIRLFLMVMKASIRTNAFQADREAIAIKLLPREIDILPEPRPMFEIFVYSPRVEGVHLRYGKVARGGLRWSDRREDFRTEVLGLVKAQMVKNTVIVPVGAKGGFVPKNLPNPAVDRAAWQAEGVACYKIFIGSLLTVTDNIVEGKVVPPADVIRWDEDDTYLVVAADKGTATFSDIANGISLERGHWLGDAFASGGSVGYDHKGMGITARGAWESVKRHFREMGIDCQNEDFTCVGIGDMAGDVFGNGMMLSEHTRLVAAFNHIHIFLDPNPDAASSHAERVRMFNERLGWDKYNPELISAGGGVHLRSAKSIDITAEVRTALGIDEGVTSMTPTELITAILKAPVDLLWNGGIGTYVKGSSETHAQVGDKANDALRINGGEVRARCAGEGGNLGWTQLGRIEYAMNGGRVNTDFIDNSAGVDTSDHEVNIKILLAQEIAAGRLPAEEREALILSLTDDVAEHVLAHNKEQNNTLANAMSRATAFAGAHESWMKELEETGYLDRKVQYMPTTAEMEKRIAEGRGLTGPELATLMAWTKIKLEDDVLASDLPDDPYLADRLIQYFPEGLRERFRDTMPEHRLHREIITTVAVNRFVDSQGITAFHRLSSETGADVADVIRAQLAARAVYNVGLQETLIRRAEGIDAATATELRVELRHLVEKGTRWMLHNRRTPLDIPAAVEQFGEGVKVLAEQFPALLTGRQAEEYATRYERFTGLGVEERLASFVAVAPALPAALSIVQVAQATGRDLVDTAKVYLTMGQELGLDVLLRRIESLPRMNRWDTMSRAALRDDLLGVHAQLTRDALEAVAGESDASRTVAEWAKQTGGVEKKAATLEEITSGEPDISRMSVGMRTVRSLLKQA